MPGITKENNEIIEDTNKKLHVLYDKLYTIEKSYKPPRFFPNVKLNKLGLPLGPAREKWSTLQLYTFAKETLDQLRLFIIANVDAGDDQSIKNLESKFRENSKLINETLDYIIAHRLKTAKNPLSAKPISIILVISVIVIIVLLLILLIYALYKIYHVPKPNTISAV